MVSEKDVYLRNLSKTLECSTLAISALATPPTSLLTSLPEENLNGPFSHCTLCLLRSALHKRGLIEAFTVTGWAGGTRLYARHGMFLNT